MKDDDSSSQSQPSWQDLVNEPFVPQPHHRTRALWGAAIAGTTVLGTLALTAPFILSRSPLPYMATPGHKIKKALEFIQKTTTDSGTTQSATARGTFVDLGSGDGEGVYQAAKAGYQQAIGIELNWTLCTVSRIRRQFFWDANLRRRSQFKNEDFFGYSLKHAQVCMIFGVIPLMKPISRKLAQECAPGTHVLAYRFQLPLAGDDNGEQDGDDNDDDSTLLNAEVVYDVEDMRVYKCK